MNIRKFLNIRSILIIITVVVVLFLSILFFSNKNGKHEIVEAVRGDLVDVTEVSGKVVPGEEINLSFEATGRISSLNFTIGDKVKKGDILARLDSSEINSEISEAVADLRSEEARLAEISSTAGGQNKLESTRNSLISTLKKAYITADGIVKNTVDTFITDPQTITPDFSTSLSNYSLRQDIETKRYTIGVVLSKWKNILNGYSVDTISLEDAEDAIENLKSIEDLLFTISLGTNDFEATQYKTQSQIDAYINAINSARTTTAGLIVDINTATEAVRSVEAEIPILQASINGASATINKLSAKSKNYIITAPFDGVITSDDVEVGQVISSGENAISMVSDAAFEVESFIPEVSIAGVDVGDNAHMIFDSFGPENIYEAFIIHIDPRETIKDGVTTYRILLGFREAHKEILSGMNVEIKIEKERIENQIIVPRYVIQKDSLGDFVEINQANGSIERVNVIVGKKDNAGNVIIEFGVSEGDKIVVPE